MRIASISDVCKFLFGYIKFEEEKYSVFWLVGLALCAGFIIYISAATTDNMTDWERDQVDTPTAAANDDSSSEEGEKASSSPKKSSSKKQKKEELGSTMTPEGKRSNRLKKTE